MDYEDKKFGNEFSFFRTGIHRKLINAGLGELCGIISLTTKRIYNNDNDNNIKKLLYSLENNKPLKEEICSTNLVLNLF